MAVSVQRERMLTNYVFETPLYSIYKPQWLDSAIKATDRFIDLSYERAKKESLVEREKFLGKKNFEKVKDHGMSYHSTPLNGVPELRELETYIGHTSHNLLDEWGYDMSQYTMHWTEFWVQEFSKNGGGHHDTHVHWDNHISGFYFLKCSDVTSRPVFHDPRHGAMMTKLPLKDKDKKSIMSDKLYYSFKPGTLVFFPSYVPHQFTVDDGIEPFRFIHFNLQAVRNGILNTARQMTNE
jgi:uncharacterized protein (TIGR02466 family)